MSRTLKFTIPGEPIGKPRMTRSDKWKRRECVLRYRDWADKARLATSGRLPPTLHILRLSCAAYFCPPASWSKKKQSACLGQLHRSKPDADNVLKCLDALFPEDCGLAALAIEKRWDLVPRLEITIEINEDESADDRDRSIRKAA